MKAAPDVHSELEALRARLAEAERLLRHVRFVKRPTVRAVIQWQRDVDAWLLAARHRHWRR